MNTAQSVTDSNTHLPYDSSLASIITAAVTCALGIFYFFVLGKHAATNATWYALTNDALKNPSKAKEQWVTKSKEILYGGLNKIKGAIAVVSPTGPVIFVPNSFAHEIRNAKELDFGKALTTDFLAEYRGLTPLSTLNHHDVMQEVVRLNLTRSLDSIIGDMNDETDAAVTDMLGNVPDWKTIDLKPLIYRIVARVSTLVFLGEEASRNEEWLDVAVSYTVNLVQAAQKLRAVPSLLRPIVQWWTPELQLCRQQVAKAREIINPMVQDRLRRKASGEITEKTADMISWVDDKAKAKGVEIDFAGLQLMFAVAALHTTTETLSLFMCDVVENESENWISRLREEMVSTLKSFGWKKTSLYSMTLLDSAMKESQRMNTLNNVAMQRLALSTITLSDGTIIPKGYKFAVESRHDDPTLYPNPEKFQADRFLKLRDTDRSKWHFVTGSPEHTAFGYGKHTCPGRFFASNEMKIILTHLLIRYDWKFTEQGRLPLVSSGTDVAADPGQKIMVKSRVAEIELGSL